MIGFRKDPNSLTMTQRTGTAILKRTYDIDPATGTLSPSGEPFPVFMQDQPDNLLLNSDFESELDLRDDEGSPVDWAAESGTVISQVVDPGDSDNHFMQANGSANSRIVQTLTFEEPLGGRSFAFSFSASADAAAQIRNARLEADGDSGTVVICDIDVNPTIVMTRFSATGTWANDLQATEMRVVLRTATSSARILFYDDVQVEERDYETVWDPATTLKFEHDMAAFKPEGDVIVLGGTDTLGVVRTVVNGVTWFSRNIVSISPPAKAAFGWEPRNVDPRLGEGGTFPEEGDAYPLEDPLPSDFNNRFYNGYRRTNGADQITETLPASSYLPSNAGIRIDLPGVSDYTFDLNEETILANYLFFGGSGEDVESNWQSASFTMNLDTLVIELDEDRCYTVWRGVWPFDQHPDDSYRRLVIEAS